MKKTIAPTRIIVNGFIITGKPSKQIATILDCIPNLKYWSTRSLLSLYKGLLEIALEYCVESKKGAERGQASSFTRQIKSYQARLKYLPARIRTEEGRAALLCKLYDLILEGEGLPVLRGFGFASKFGDPMAGNAETQSSKRKGE